MKKEWDELKEIPVMVKSYIDSRENINRFSRLWEVSPKNTKKRTADAIRIKLQIMVREERINQNSIIIPKSHHPKYTEYPRLTGDALVLGDLHIPYHDSVFIEKCLKIADLLGIEQTILGGDLIESSAMSQWSPDFDTTTNKISSDAREKLEGLFLDMRSGEEKDSLGKILSETDAVDGLGEEIKETREVIASLEKYSSKVLWFMGNHENRAIRILQRTMPAATFSQLFMENDPKWEVSSYYECELLSGGKTWRITHPINSTKGSSKKMSSKYLANIIMLHNHHFSMQTDPSGKFLAIEPGACVDQERLSYEIQRDSTGDTHVQGAIIIKDGLPILLNQWTDWKTLEGKMYQKKVR